MFTICLCWCKSILICALSNKKMFIFFQDLEHGTEKIRCKHPDWMLGWMVSLKPDLGIMIGNHKANMDYMIQRCQWKMVMERRARWRWNTRTHCKYIQVHRNLNAYATIPYVHYNGRNKCVGFVWPSTYPLIHLHAFSNGPPLPVNSLLSFP